MYKPSVFLKKFTFLCRFSSLWNLKFALFISQQICMLFTHIYIHIRNFNLYCYYVLAVKLWTMAPVISAGQEEGGEKLLFSLLKLNRNYCHGLHKVRLCSTTMNSTGSFFTPVKSSFAWWRGYLDNTNHYWCNCQNPTQPNINLT